MATYCEDLRPQRLSDAAAAPKRRWLVCGAIALVLAGLVAMQMRNWGRFDWHTFLAETRGIQWMYVVDGVLLAYFTVILRAWRWKLLMQAQRDVPARRLVPPTFIGFAALALLGRPGELLRPYLIARKEQVSMASQIGVWTVERTFDIGAFVVIAGVDLAFARASATASIVRAAGLALIVLFAAFCIFGLAVYRHAERLARWLCGRGNVGRGLAAKLMSFREGLRGVGGQREFALAAVLSIAIWMVITLSTAAVVWSYPSLRSLSMSDNIVLVALSNLGGIVQLPAAGGGAQIATALGLIQVFHVPHELAVSCAVLLWLVAFQSVLPIGLLLARRESVSISNMTLGAEPAAEMAVEGSGRVA